MKQIQILLLALVAVLATSCVGPRRGYAGGYPPPGYYPQQQMAPQQGFAQQAGEQATQQPTVVGAAPAAVAFAPVDQGEFTDIPLTNMRRVIAKRLQESKSSIPHYYLTSEIVMDKVLKCVVSWLILFINSSLIDYVRIWMLTGPGNSSCRLMISL